jgi:hypothetical protein
VRLAHFLKRAEIREKRTARCAARGVLKVGMEGTTMDRRTFRKQIAESTRTALEALALSPDDPKPLFMVDLLSRMGAHDPALAQGVARFAKWKHEVGEDAARATLREQGMLEFLRRTWAGLGESHYDGDELMVLADAMIALTTEASELGQLPYAFGNWEPTWRQVGVRAAKACERLAAVTLARDPQNESALWLYAQADFRARTKTKGPPVAKPTTGDVLAKIERVISMHEGGMHPLDVPSLETIAEFDAAVVRALIGALDRLADGAGRSDVIEALGRAAASGVERARVIDVFAAMIAHGDESTVDHVAMAAHYEMKGKAPELLGAFVARATLLVSQLSARDSGDYRHQWALRAVLSVLPHARGEQRAAGVAFVTKLLADAENMPAWKRERLFELAHEGPGVLARVLRRAA